MVPDKIKSFYRRQKFEAKQPEPAVKAVSERDLRLLKRRLAKLVSITAGDVAFATIPALVIANGEF